ncbi:MAG: alpha/beta hydrolase, partial [Thermoleophilaceae bacterium]|nr:alpha/beta hydrolase [Thermoleophilaceae bacterium]
MKILHSLFTKSSIVFSAVLLGLFALAASAQAVPAAEPCLDQIDQLECLTVEVPLDRSGSVGGTARIQAVKLLAQEGPRLGTLVVLAGGPGQSSSSILEDVAWMLAGAERYDIVAVDQRGTGYSEPLNCLSLARATVIGGSDPTKDKPITSCANDLGGARAAYNTEEAAADLDAVRVALGLDTWTVFGVSYGTKLALAYAGAFPTHVRSMLLDSVLPLDGPEALDTTSTAAMRRSLGQVCSDNRCKSFLPTPVSTTTAFVKQLESDPVIGYRADSDGKYNKVKVTPSSLYETFFAADFNPFIYTQMPAAIASARRGDTDMLVRMQTISEGGSNLHVAPPLSGKLPRKIHSHGTAFSDAMYFATTCEDLAAPWARGAALGSRQPAIDAAAAAVPDNLYRPFDRKTVKDESSASACRGWPESAVAPTLPSTMPNVPTLILNGSLDVRTPTAWAQRVAATLPNAQLVEIPNVGHSTTGTDLSSCSLSLARRFLIFGSTSGKCKRTTPSVPVQKPAPMSVTSVEPLRGSCRKAGKPRRCRGLRKSVTAGYLAMHDAVDQLVIGGATDGLGLRG